MKIEELIRNINSQWMIPREAHHDGVASRLRLKCSFEEPTNGKESLNGLPQPVREFWECANKARLFEDVDYGQWGLEILSRDEAKLLTEIQMERRKSDYIYGDLIVGRFLGDSDLLIVRCDRSATDFGHIIVSLPVDSRSDWDLVAKDFFEFLTKLANAEGGKYWEHK